eukprot:scaffold181108_cov32-Prasinocladus_malaysianus.AAC.2
MSPTDGNAFGKRPTLTSRVVKVARASGGPTERRPFVCWLHVPADGSLAFTYGPLHSGSVVMESAYMPKWPISPRY